MRLTCSKKQATQGDGTYTMEQIKAQRKEGLFKLVDCPDRTDRWYAMGDGSVLYLSDFLESIQVSTMPYDSRLKFVQVLDEEVTVTLP